MGEGRKEKKGGHTSSSASRRHQATQRASRGSIAPAGRASDSASATPNASASHTRRGDWWGVRVEVGVGVRVGLGPVAKYVRVMWRPEWVWVRCGLVV